MTLPTIHSNGTSPEMLRRGYSEARLAVENAILAIERIEFNGRDYYVQGQAAFKAANFETVQRIRLLRTVREELERIELHCQDAIDAREAQKR